MPRPLVTIEEREKMARDYALEREREQIAATEREEQESAKRTADIEARNRIRDVVNWGSVNGHLADWDKSAYWKARGEMWTAEMKGEDFLVSKLAKAQIEQLDKLIVSLSGIALAAAKSTSVSDEQAAAFADTAEWILGFAAEGMSDEEINRFVETVR